MSRCWRLVLAATMVALVGSQARAGFDPQYLGMTSTATTSTFNYRLAFDPTISGGSVQLVTGNYLTLYDLYASPTSLASISTPTGITATELLVGTTPTAFTTQTVDSPTLYNVTFTYSGTTLTAATNFSVSIVLNGQFTTAFHNYTSFTQYTATGGGTGTSSTLGSVTTPTPAVPEPSSIALCGLAGVIGLAVARVRRKQAVA